MEKKNDLEETDYDYEEPMSLAEFIIHFNVHYRLLLKRYARFKEIDNLFNTDIDVITYLDMIVVQLRAICIENSRLTKNYTAQILLRKIGENKLANRIDAMLDEAFIPESNFNIRKAIKTLADGFICHYDNFDGIKADGWYWAETIEKRLRNPYDKPNLDYIIKTIVDCLGDGLTLKNLEM